MPSQLQAFGAKLNELCHYMPLQSTFDIPVDVYDQDFIDNDDVASLIEGKNVLLKLKPAENNSFRRNHCNSINYYQNLMVGFHMDQNPIKARPRNMDERALGPRDCILCTVVGWVGGRRAVRENGYLLGIGIYREKCKVKRWGKGTWPILNPWDEPAMANSEMPRIPPIGRGPGPKPGVQVPRFRMGQCLVSFNE
ncbi:hypothetical protein COCNU_06G012860 [Cocos nucifera]|uniref:Uncharacterized protein n=1 Tax=Cocos nucifera TaxID=13894 RepID=A0A8K0ICQ4_COCNU|nr:hypothetical protein COCNU_06G012860 [Cocos nucifera]